MIEPTDSYIHLTMNTSVCRRVANESISPKAIILSPVPMGVKMVKLLPKNSSLLDDSGTEKWLCSEANNHESLRDGSLLDAVHDPQEELVSRFVVCNQTPPSSKKGFRHFQDKGDDVSPITINLTPRTPAEIFVTVNDDKSSKAIKPKEINQARPDSHPKEVKMPKLNQRRKRSQRSLKSYKENENSCD